MSKGLEALEEIKESEQFIEFQGTYGSEPEYILVGEFFEEELETIEKELKAFEIIKSKGIDIDLLKYHKDLEHYNFSLRGKFRHLTQEEYDLLKEMFYEIY